MVAAGSGSFSRDSFAFPQDDGGTGRAMFSKMQNRDGRGKKGGDANGGGRSKGGRGGDKGGKGGGRGGKGKGGAGPGGFGGMNGDFEFDGEI